jgi:hypothetical protein
MARADGICVSVTDCATSREHPESALPLRVGVNCWTTRASYALGSPSMRQSMLNNLLLASLTLLSLTAFAGSEIDLAYCGSSDCSSN